VHRGPGVDALASSQSFWLVWLPPMRSCTDWGVAWWRSPDLRGQANPFTESQTGILFPRCGPRLWCIVCGVAAQTPRATDRDPRSTPPSTGVSVRAGADSRSGDAARTDSAQAISSAPEPVAPPADQHRQADRDPDHARADRPIAQSPSLLQTTTKPIPQGGASSNTTSVKDQLIHDRQASPGTGHLSGALALLG
jgi:hypothetical protein